MSVWLARKLPRRCAYLPPPPVLSQTFAAVTSAASPSPVKFTASLTTKACKMNKAIRASVGQQPRGSPRPHRGEEPAGEGLQPDGATPFGPCLRI
ncbi:unnamed protein product [Ectocarpus sp. 6 AP-2014]